MNINYDRELETNEVSVRQAKCQLPLFGRWCEMTITSYCLQQTAITFGFRGLSNKDLAPKTDTITATVNGMLTLSRGTGGNRQDFTQSIEVPRIIGQLLDYSDLQNGGVDAARTVLESVLRRVESIIETARQHIIKHFSNDPEVRELALNRVHHRFDEVTRCTISEFLGKINWLFMLEKSGGDSDFATVLEGAPSRNPPRSHTILERPSDDIMLIASAPLNRFNKATVANMKATALLKNVCGEEHALEFENTGQIVVKERGYRFAIRPGDFLTCTDPNGHTARLCIHTLGFQVNPIDEVIIAYLHIKHQFEAYMQEAVVHSPEPGFSKTLG